MRLSCEDKIEIYRLRKEGWTWSHLSRTFVGPLVISILAMLTPIFVDGKCNQILKIIDNSIHLLTIPMRV